MENTDLGDGVEDNVGIVGVSVIHGRECGVCGLGVGEKTTTTRLQSGLAREREGGRDGERERGRTVF